MSPVSWRKSSYSSSGNCVEVGKAGQTVKIRDTKNQGTAPELTFKPGAWRRFVAKVKAS